MVGVVRLLGCYIVTSEICPGSGPPDLHLISTRLLLPVRSGGASLTSALSSARMADTVALGSSCSCGSVNGLPAVLISHAEMMVNI